MFDLANSTVHCSFKIYSPLIYHNAKPLSNQSTGYASQHNSVPVPSQEKLGGLWQEGHSA